MNRMKMIGDAFSDGLASAQSIYAGGDIDGALTALATAADAAVTEDQALSVQTNLANIQSAASSVDAMAPQPGNPSGPAAGTSTDSNYSAALGLVTQIQTWLNADSAASAGGGGGGGGGGTTPSGGGSALTDPNVVAALQAMLAVSDFTQPAACAPVKGFQSAYNAAGGAPALSVDGGYGVDTANAAQDVAGANSGAITTAIPAALTSGFPSCGGGQVPVPPPPGPGPGPIVPASGSGLPMWAKVILGMVIVGGIGTALYFLYKRSKKKKSGHGAREAPKRRRRKRSKKSRR